MVRLETPPRRGDDVAEPGNAFLEHAPLEGTASRTHRCRVAKREHGILPGESRTDGELRSFDDGNVGEDDPTFQGDVVAHAIQPSVRVTHRHIHHDTGEDIADRLPREGIVSRAEG